MSRPSHRDKLIQEGMKVLHQRGYAGASVRDIVKAAGVPQGSFTNHFSSKEAFGVEILDLYYDKGREFTRKTLLNETLSPLKRLRAWIDGMLASYNQNQQWNGCMLGNFGAEAGNGAEMIQKRVRELFLEIQRNLAICITAAIDAGELADDTNAKDLAVFIHTSLEGAVLGAKSTQSLAPMKTFRRVLFSQLLPVNK